MCHERGIKVCFLTAPQALDQGIPEYLYTSGEVADPTTLVQLHQSFNDVVREITKSTSSTLIDLASEFDQTNKAETFEFDHIHLTDVGKQLVANRLLRLLQSEGRLTVSGPTADGSTDEKK